MAVTALAIRLDGPSPTALISVLDKDGGAYLVVKELADSNVHYHVILHSVRKLSAVRAAIKRAMPEVNGNGSYSVTLVRDVSKYERYMMKGDSAEELPQVVAAHGMTYTSVDWHREQHDAYWAENALLGANRRKRPIIETVLIACKEAKYSWTNREAIAKVYIKEVVDRDRPINIFSAKAAVNLLQVKLCPNEDALDDLARNV